jgi:hypothetical protein
MTACDVTDAMLLLLWLQQRQENGERTTTKLRMSR